MNGFDFVCDWFSVIEHKLSNAIVACNSENSVVANQL